MLSLYAILLLLGGIHIQSDLLVLVCVLFLLVFHVAYIYGAPPIQAAFYGILASGGLILLVMRRIEHFKTFNIKSFVNKNRKAWNKKNNKGIRRVLNKQKNKVIGAFKKKKKSKKKKWPVVTPIPPILSTFRNSTFVATPPKSQDTCSVYYTTYQNECDEGILSLSDKELKERYDKRSYNKLKGIISTLPEPGVCKVNLQNWRIGQNAVPIIAVGSDIQNRGNINSWAFCFQPIQTPADFQALQEKHARSDTFIIHPDPLTDVFGDGLSYARMAFRNLDFNTVKNAVCSNVNTPSYVNPVFASNLIGITLDPLPDGSFILRDMGIYNYGKDATIKTAEISPNHFAKFFEQVTLQRRKKEKKKRITYYAVAIKPQLTGIQVYKFGKDICGYQRLLGTVTGYAHLGDFGIGTILLTGYARTAPATDPNAIAQIETTKMNSIKTAVQTMLGKKLPYKIHPAGSEGNGIPPQYISNDNRLYFYVS